ncbi:hypothetical protein ACHWQZ_G006813 [Mnemiopsis leidyi]
MVGCLAEYACEQPTETLLDFSTQISPAKGKCDFRRLLLSNPKHCLGPWTGGISPVISHKPRVKKGSAPLPVPVLPRVPDQIDRPFSFSQLSNYVYPSPYIREYRNLVKLSHEPANSNRLPELKIKPISLPCLGISNSRSIPSSGSQKSSSVLTKTLCLQNGSVQTLSPDFKLPFLNLENGVLCKKKKASELKKKKHCSKSSLQSCSLVNLGLDLFHHPAMIICPKKITVLKHDGTKNKGKNRLGLPKI